MDRGNAAEWLLRRVVDAERAGELVGDQIESRPGAGMLRFWLSIGWLVWVFSWRTVVGMVVSPVAGVLLATGSFHMLSGQVGRLGYSQPSAAFFVEQYYLGISILLWMATAYSLVGFGVRNVLTLLSFLAALLGTAACCLFWLPYGKFACTAGAIGLLLLSLSDVKRRRALCILLCSVTGMWVTAYSLSRVFPYPNSVFGRWQFLLAVFLVPLVEAGTVSWLQKRLTGEFENKSRLPF